MLASQAAALAEWRSRHPDFAPNPNGVEALSAYVRAGEALRAKGGFGWMSETLGHAYIDARASKGSRTDGRADYVKAQTAVLKNKTLDALRGLSFDAVREEYRAILRRAGDTSRRDDEIYALVQSVSALSSEDRAPILRAVIRELYPEGLSAHETLELLRPAA